MNQKLSLNSQAESPSDDALTPSDDAVRQALLRMGAGSGPGGGQHGHNGHARRGGEQASAASASPDARRRRFSQNEHVPVEYVSRDRSTRGHETNRHEPVEPVDDRTGFLERDLEREKQARLTAERSLAETRTALQHAQTRLAHLEIDLTEARAQRQALLAVAPPAPAVVPSAMQQDGLFEADAMPPIKRGRGRPRLTPPHDAAQDVEPEPVKWWIGD